MGGMVIFHLVYHLMLKERAMVPKSGDLSESIKVVKTFITKEPEPPFGKYLPEQRLAYAAIAIPVLMQWSQAFSRHGRISMPRIWIGLCCCG